jgi:hypothetical protein
MGEVADRAAFVAFGCRERSGSPAVAALVAFDLTTALPVSLQICLPTRVLPAALSARPQLLARSRKREQLARVDIAQR